MNWRSEGKGCNDKDYGTRDKGTEGQGLVHRAKEEVKLPHYSQFEVKNQKQRKDSNGEDYVAK